MANMENEMKSFWIRYHYPRGKNIRLPPSFTEKWGASIHDEVKIKTKDGKVWVIHVERHNNDIWLGTKWSEFKLSHNIKFRDSIYFKYKGGNVFQVVVFGLNGLEKLSKKAKESKMPVHFCKKLVTRGFASKMVVPDAFCASFRRHLHNPLTLVGFDKVEWKVNCSSTAGSMWFTDGWEGFVQHYKLKRNDILIFKFDWTPNMQVDVLHSDSGRIDQFHTGTRPDPWDINNQVWELWTAKLTKSSAEKWTPLYVPAKVVNEDLHHMPETIKVKLPSLSSGYYQNWTMIWSAGRNECKIGDGWYQFKQHNKLKAGDRVRFGRRGMQDFFQVEIV